MSKKRIHFCMAGLEKRSFSLPFNGGMIWCEHLDSLGDDEESFRAKLSTDCNELSKPSAPSHLAFVLDETAVNDSCCEMMVDALVRQAHPKKAAFVGTSPAEKRQINACLRKTDVRFAVSFYDDLEEAKHWLIP